MNLKNKRLQEIYRIIIAHGHSALSACLLKQTVFTPSYLRAAYTPYFC